MSLLSNVNGNWRAKNVTQEVNRSGKRKLDSEQKIGEMVAVSQSIFGFHTSSSSGGGLCFPARVHRAPPSPSLRLPTARWEPGVSFRNPPLHQHYFSWSGWAIGGANSVFSYSKAPTTLTFNSVGEAIGVEPDSTGSGGDSTRDSGGWGGGGDNSDNREGRGGEGEEENQDGESNKKKKVLSMSQKLTLVYAALVGVGGLMGFLKSGSQKSLMSGGLSALLLYYVYSQLPSKPVFASSLGFGISAALLVVMGSRFKNSGKIFPAGVVSAVSLVMTGGYLHGIFRSVQ